MKDIKIRVLTAEGSTRDTTVGKVYEAVYLEKGDRQLGDNNYIVVNAPMISFIDDIGDRLYTYVTTNFVEVVEGEK